MAAKEKTPNIGRKIERIRMLRGIKQETFAAMLGVTQGAVSRMEKSEKVSDDKLTEVAQALGVTTDAIKNFDEIASINNNIYDQNNTVINYQFNPIEKIVELYEQILKEKNQQLIEKNELIEMFKKQQNS